ncbi:DUF5011 domain-containing protein [Hyunsoonleella flava]|uniref:DUF5011 domain-containing protein n=2 Tax=Pseudomonadati TaxID=3379134 RepID=A0A4Q9FAC4_9FLAO|nr:immunoglobulin-like domain-containing protein [Hyunsoonleella flava]TBM99356.1 DUF5011 domain-containing protein [Hyunsoonleella flava]
MKKFTLCLVALFNVLFIFSQQNDAPKRISIANPSQFTIQKIQKAGIDLSCGPRFINNNLELELSYAEIQELQKSGVNYQVLIDDLTTYYSNRNAFDLPIAKNQLRSLKKKPKKQASGSLTQKSLSLQNILVGNPTQHDECEEINWPVPTNFQLGSMGGCLTVDETLAQLDLMRSLYPNLISVKTDASPTGQTTHGNSTGGTTWLGQTVYYVRISDNPDIDEAAEPETLITGMIHAREVNSLMNIMYFMWYILENYDSDPFIKNIVDNQELYFVPIINPDGLRWNEVIAPNGGGLQRKNLRPGVADNGSTSTSNNVRGIDLNRNFNYYWGFDNSGSSPTQSSNTYRGASAGSEPETQIIQDFVAQHDFKVGVNHHSGLNSIVTSSYNGSLSAADSGREDEYAKICHDLTHYNRYIYGSAPNTLTAANGDANDWMLGGPAVTSGGQTSSGSGKDILAFAPENGDDFWPLPSQITPIAQSAVRTNFLSVLYSGKFAKLHDLNFSAISSTSGNLTFGVEYLGKTYDDITLTVTPVSSNITSMTSPSTQTGWTKLEQRNLTVSYTLAAGIQPNDEIEFQVTLSNNDFVLYQANYVKYYQSNVLFADNPDATGTSNWSTSGGSWGTTSDAYSGSAAITDSPSGSYSNNENKTITLNSSIDLSGTSQALVQYYAKWDLERNYDLVQIEASTNGGGSWTALCGNYNKPAAGFDTNFHLNKNTSTFRNHQSTNGDIVYDGDTMDKWVMEEIYINATENTFLLGQSNVQIRFRLKSDSVNREDDLTTTFDGFTFDDFRVISIETPCVLSIPTAVATNNVTETGASITWDNIPSSIYDLRYREVGTQNWNDVNGLSTPNYDITGLANLTDYEVQVRANCGANSSAYSSSITFTTLDVQLNYCASASTNVNDEYISRVQLNTIDNASGPLFYSDFTNISTPLEKGSQYTITITPTWTGQVYAEAYSVWIDYNRDGDFEDAGEQVFTQNPTNATSVSGSFTVPSSAVENSTRMRVSMQYNQIPASCQTFQYGEVEDYTIVIEGAGPDVTPPFITLNGTTPVNVTLGSAYTEEGATATDNLDGDISANIVVGGDTVNTNTLGIYVVTYDVSDAAGNAAAQVTRTVNVVDAIPGCSGGITAYPYSEGFEVSIGAWTQASGDDLDWLVISNNTPSNNTGPSGAVEGSSYIYVEASGNGTGYPNKRAIINSPCFDLSAASAADFSFQYHMFGAADMGTIDLEVSNDDGATWSSIWSQSGNQGNSWLTVNIDLDTYAGGSIQLRFNRFVGSTWQADIALDDINLTTVEQDTTAPVITLVGTSPIDLNVGDTYTEQGATATDNIDGDITANIVIGGDIVDTNTAGTYVVTYNVSDNAGNTATQVTRTVNVIPDTTAPVITLVGASTIDLDVGGTYTEQGATATDNIDGDISANIVIGGDVVDTNIGGTYVVTYDASDASGNPATQVTRTVNVIPDTTAPAITLVGASTIDLDVGGTYTEQGATATDNIDGNITANIVIGGDTVDTNTAGTYVVTYNVSDNAGNPATQVTRTVNVIPDTTAPVITLVGASTIDINVGGTYTEQGATATDNIDGDISANIVIGGDLVDTNIGGTYVVTYDVSDAAGNPATQVTRTVNIIPDTTAPVITLVGASPIDLNVGDTYTEEGATATDNIDGDISANIVIGGDTVDTNTGGTYVVTYDVSDAAGNPATQVTRTVNIIPDTTAPVITLVGASPIDLNVGDTYTEEGATATDNIDGDISANIVIGGDTVDTNTGGTYVVTYDVSDNAGNPATQVTRTVNVIPDTTAPVITLIGASTIDLDVGATYTEQGATATDNIDGDITANIIIGGDTVDTNTAGTYVVTFNVNDNAGNAATQVIRTVNVIPDTTAPVITLVGASTIDLDVGGTYTEQGATATDNIDGDITANIVIGGDIVDTNTAGTYVVTYDVSDAAGNPATQVTRTVNVIPDTTAPVITLVGASTIDLDVGGTYTEQGATAIDNIDGDITANIVIGGDTVDTNTAGTYVVTYDVSDAAGNPATQVTRTVNVIPDTTVPVITLVGASTIDLNVGDTYPEQGATAMDNIDGDITANIVIGGDIVDTNTAGTYVVTYNVNDNAGNPATEVTRTVNVNSVPTDVVLHQGFFESGWDGWIDGGTDCARRNDSRSYEGNFSIRIRDNSGVGSSMTYSNVDLTSFAEVQVDFYFYVYSMENNEDFWLRFFDGSSWITVETWARAIEINNNTFYNATVVIPASVYNFSSNSGFRFQCDASGNADQIFIDQVTITGFGSPTGSGNTLVNLGGTTKTGIDKQVEEEEEFIVYPNPVKGEFINVSVPGTSNFDYKVINMIGQIVAEGKSTGKIKVDRIESGVYMLQVYDGDELLTKRIIKE